MEKQDEVGVVQSLAWTENGGEIMAVEVAVLEGKGSLQMTGQLGEVMQESGQAALDLHQIACCVARRRYGSLRAHGHPSAHARRRDPEGRPFGRDHHCDCNDLCANRAARLSSLSV